MYVKTQRPPQSSIAIFLAFLLNIAGILNSYIELFCAKQVLYITESFTSP